MDLMSLKRSLDIPWYMLLPSGLSDRIRKNPRAEAPINFVSLLFGGIIGGLRLMLLVL
jgi:hypothetical protein